MEDKKRGMVATAAKAAAASSEISRLGKNTAANAVAVEKGAGKIASGAGNAAKETVAAVKNLSKKDKTKILGKKIYGNGGKKGRYGLGTGKASAFKTKPVRLGADAAGSPQTLVTKVNKKSRMKKYVKKIQISRLFNEAAKTAGTLDTEDSAAELVKHVGETGITLFISMGTQAFKLALRASAGLIRLAAVALGPWLVIVPAVFIIFVCMFANDSETRRHVAAASSEITATSLESPRLTSDGILENAWYVGNENPFTAAGYGIVREVNGVTYYGNCTAYAWGRWAEILGYAPSLPTGNACDWYASNEASGTYEYGQEPRPGAIACWAYRNGGAGHVAVVEVINDDGSITFSESRYSGGRVTNPSNIFYVRTLSSAENIWIFQGYIYLPETEEEE